MLDLFRYRQLNVNQIFEAGELLGFETRNKYQVMDESHGLIAYAAEEKKGILDFLARNFLGHWRNFNIHFFDSQRQVIMTARHPFRFFFQRLEVFNAQGQFMGAIQQRFGILSKRFDVENEHGQCIFEVASPLLSLWTFPFLSHGREIACVRKKWSGLLSEAFTDRDRFSVEFQESDLNNNERHLILAASIFIDLRYFEQKSARN